MNRRVLGGLLACWCLASPAWASPVADRPRAIPTGVSTQTGVETVDFPRLADEAAEHLSRLVRINTVNPPGNERAACDYLGAALKAGGVPYEVLESTPGRASLIARLKGDGSKRPLLLLAHLDTVGVEEAAWSFPPFSGARERGYVHGRGSVDNKSMAAAGLVVLLQLQRERARLRRDVILAAVADEESGGGLGVRWLLEKHPDKVLAEYAVNEGGTTQVKEGKVRLVAVQTLEKSYFDVRLTARGSSGHASVPQADNAIHALSRALTRLGAWEGKLSLNPVTRAFLQGLAPLEEGGTRRAIEDALSGDSERQAEGAETLRAANPYYYAMMTDSVVPTVIAGGIRENVVASEAWANLNMRLLPETEPERFFEELRSVIEEPAVDMEVVSRPSGPPPPPMPVDNEMFAAFEKVARRLSPGAVVVPSMSVGSTDSESLRRRGVSVYGFEFPLSFEDESRIHGHDERMPEAGLDYGVRFLHALVTEVAR